MSPVQILIADDHALFRRSLRTLIESRPDWRVCGEAVDGRDAVEKTKQLHPDVILMDVTMPRMNGLDATRLILQDWPNAWIVIISQNEAQLIEKTARDLGAKRFVSKSSVFQELVTAIEQLLKHSGNLVGQETPSQSKPAPAPKLVKVRGTQLVANDNRERYRQKLARITLDSMVQFVGLLDAKGTVLEINHVALDAVGIKLSEVEGKPFWTTFWWQVSDEINATLRESIRRAAQGEFVRWDAEIYGRAGGKETIIIDASLMPVKDEQGKVVFITAEGRDITEKKAHEREIVRQREELAKLDELKTRFFANISHEFRTPLTLLMGPLEDAMAQPGELSASNRERVELAHRNSLRLLKLVNTLLDFSRIEAGRIQASYEPTDLATFTADLASVFRSTIERAGLQLLIDCSPMADPVYVDREMWEKIVFNLLSNAFKFTLSGEIEVSLRGADGSAELAVRDTGTGIPPQDVPHLFERFYRIKGAQGRTFEGSGIGLALVQELARLHGGTVRVESELGHGSKFIVAVPMGDGHLPADRIGAPRTMTSTGVRGEAFVQEALRWLPESELVPGEITDGPSVSLPASAAVHDGEPRPRILLADDNADMRDYVQRLLRKQYEVLAVADGEAALASALEWHPHLILSDIMMPRLDGFGLLHGIRADESLKHVPVILLCGRAGEEARIEGLSSGADDYLVKPFSARELEARISSHLAMAAIRGQSAELERKLRHDAEMLAAIVASSDDAIISKNLDGFITSWNDGAERIFGYSPQEAIGQHITLIIPPDRHLEEAQILQRLRRGERLDHFETIRMRKDGTRLDISVTISPLRDPQGRVIGASKVARDISKQKQAEMVWQENHRRTAETLEAEVRARTKELEQRNADVLRQSEQVRDLSGRLLRTQDEERRHIARELHDSAGQTLAVLGMSVAELVRKAAMNWPGLAADAEMIRETVQQLSREIRTASYLLHPPLLDEAGLSSALNWYIQGLTERSGLIIKHDISSHIGRLPRDMELAIFRLLQECLTNIHRHSGSHTATIRMARQRDLLSIEIQDEGKGMSPERLAEIQSKASGVGILGMRERLRQFRGEMKIESGPSGTRIRVSIPIPHDDTAEEAKAAEPMSATP